MSLDHDISIVVRKMAAVSVLRSRLAALTFPQPPSSPPREAAEGGGSRRSSDPAPASYNDGASIRSPLSRSAGAGPGVRARRSYVFHRVGRGGFGTRPYWRISEMGADSTAATARCGPEARAPREPYELGMVVRL